MLKFSRSTPSQDYDPERNCSGIVLDLVKRGGGRKCAVTAAFFTPAEPKEAGPVGGGTSFIIFSGCRDCRSSSGALNHRRSPPESRSDGWEPSSLWPTRCRLLLSLVQYASRFIGPPLSARLARLAPLAEQKVKALE